MVSFPKTSLPKEKARGFNKTKNVEIYDNFYAVFSTATIPFLLQLLESRRRSRGILWRAGILIWEWWW